MVKTPRRPRDPNQLARMIVDLATGAIEEAGLAKPEQGDPGKRLGGKARAAKLTPTERSDIARRAAAMRWNKSRTC